MTWGTRELLRRERHQSHVLGLLNVGKPMLIMLNKCVAFVEATLLRTCSNNAAAVRNWKLQLLFLQSSDSGAVIERWGFHIVVCFPQVGFLRILPRSLVSISFQQWVFSQVVLSCILARLEGGWDASYPSIVLIWLFPERWFLLYPSNGVNVDCPRVTVDALV